MRARTAATVLLVGLATAAVGCEKIIGADFGSQRLAVCTPARPPVWRGGPASGGSISFTVAVHTVAYGESDDANGIAGWKSIGFDFDGRCTSGFDAPPCEPAPWTGATVTDGINGIDNAIGSMLYDQSSAFGLKPFTSDRINAATADGTYAPTAVFRVSGYDGYGIDDQVTVEWFITVPPKSGTAPKWDGSDVWPASPKSAVATDGGGGYIAKYVDMHAYVQDFRLVALFSEGAVLSLVNVDFGLADGLMSADIVSETPGRWRLTNGTLGGHGTIKELFAHLPELTYSFVSSQAFVCTDASIYPKLKSWMCAHADSLLGNEPSGASCDVASFGIGFDTTQAQLGALAPAVPPPNLCTPDKDPANDSCAAPPSAP
jgi:hypothetical protein